jgi:hypothetical protein
MFLAFLKEKFVKWCLWFFCEIEDHLCELFQPEFQLAAGSGSGNITNGKPFHL